MRVVFALLLTAGVVLANAPPPRSIRIPVDATVKLDKDTKGFVLFFEQDSGELPKRVDLSTDKEVAVPFDRPTDKSRLLQGVRLLAVPEDLVAKLKTTADWKAAREQKNSPILGHWFNGFVAVGIKDRQNAVKDVVKKAYIIQSVDAKDGIKVAEVKDAKELKALPNQQPPSKKPLALSEPGYLIGGLAAAVSITLGGLWLVRRRK